VVNRDGAKLQSRLTYWTTSEISTLKEFAHLGVEELSSILGRSIPSVKTKAHHEGISLARTIETSLCEICDRVYTGPVCPKCSAKKRLDAARKRLEKRNRLIRQSLEVTDHEVAEVNREIARAKNQLYRRKKDPGITERGRDSRALR